MIVLSLIKFHLVVLKIWNCPDGWTGQGDFNMVQTNHDIRARTRSTCL